MDAFNARFTSTFTPDRLYRVYLERGEAFFIRIGGQGGGGRALAHQFGLLGGLVWNLIKKRVEAKFRARLAAVDMRHPSMQVRAHKHNFRAAAPEFESSTLEPATTIASHGEHFGRWLVKLRGRKPMTLQLETLADMQRAVDLLPRFLPRHSSNVVWNAAKNRFDKRVS